MNQTIQYLLHINKCPRDAINATKTHDLHPVDVQALGSKESVVIAYGTPLDVSMWFSREDTELLAFRATTEEDFNE